MKFVIKVKAGIIEYNGEPYREILDKEVVRTIDEARQVLKRFQKKYPENEIETKEFSDCKWKPVKLWFLQLKRINIACRNRQLA